MVDKKIIEKIITSLYGSYLNQCLKHFSKNCSNQDFNSYVKFILIGLNNKIKEDVRKKSKKQKDY